MMSDAQLSVVESGAMTPAQLLQVAVQNGASMDQLERLMALEERWNAAKAKKSFDSAMAEFKKSPPRIQKDRAAIYNGRTQYLYSNLSDICVAVDPALAANGFRYRWSIRQDGGVIFVKSHLSHVDGHEEVCELFSAPDTSGSKNAIQAVGSATSYLQKYTLLANLGMSTSDMDTDGVPPGPIKTVTEDQASEIECLAQEVGADKDAFLKFIGAESYELIPAASYNKAITALERKRNQ